MIWAAALSGFAAGIVVAAAACVIWPEQVKAAVRRHGKSVS